MRLLVPDVRRRVFIVLIIAVLVLVGVVYPFESTVVPAWSIRVIDEAGRPYAGMEVSQAWKHDSLELEGGENMETRSTDASGYVEFPDRTLRLSLVSRFFRMAFTRAAKLLHGSTGIHARVAATGPQGYKSVEYVPGKPPPEQLVLPSKGKELSEAASSPLRNAR